MVATRLPPNETSHFNVSSRSPPKTEGTPRHMQRGMLQSGAKTEGCRGEREQQEAWAKASRLKMRGTARLPTSPYL